MCIATSWPAASVAMLAIIFELASAALSWSLLTRGDSNSVSALGGSCAALVGCALVRLWAPRERAPTSGRRAVPALLCVVAIVCHLCWGMQVTLRLEPRTWLVGSLGLAAVGPCAPLDPSQL